MKQKIDPGKILYRLMYALLLNIALFGQAWAVITGSGILSEYSGRFSFAAAFAGGAVMVLALSYLLSCLITLSKYTKAAFAVIIPAGLVISMISGAVPVRICVSALLVLIPLLGADLIRCFSGKKDESRIISLFPFFVIIFLFINFVPISKDPVDWSGVAGIFERISDAGKKIVNRFGIGVADYESASMGFDGENGLFKSVRENHDEVMNVTAESFLGGAVYLTGKVYSDFDGMHWTFRGEEETENLGRLIDTIETLSAVYETYPKNIYDICYPEKNEIVIKNMKTEYAFCPSKAVISPGGQPQVHLEGDNVFFPEEEKFGYEYRVEYYVLNRDGEDLVKNHRTISEETWDRIAMKYKTPEGYIYTYDDLLEYRDSVRKIYGKKPLLSDEVMNLTEEIAGDSDSEYVKLKRIERWLSEHEYSTEIDISAEDLGSPERFMDRFLIENTSGYCSYYATAFVLMARAEGIPARYVEGYRIDENEYETVKVYSNMAHAWPEAYIEGVGWIKFDPTPGFERPAVWGEPLMPPEYYEGDAGSHGEDIYDEETELSELIKEAREEKERQKEEERLRVKAEKKRKRQILFSTIGAMAGSAIIIFVITAFAAIVSEQKKMNRKNKNSGLKAVCRRNFLILDSMGLKPMQGETLCEFERRASEELSENGMRFVGIYENILYSGKEDGDYSEREVEELYDAASEDNRMLKERIRKEKIRVRIKYLFAIIRKSGRR